MLQKTCHMMDWLLVKGTLMGSLLTVQFSRLKSAKLATSKGGPMHGLKTAKNDFLAIKSHLCSLASSRKL